ncbi:mandelate racemase/muconate lactonizing enzyme family protein [Aliiroseovarius sp. YM-037]|uniref:mandelate racemase/muconate lactonizing enzyme family protein n=1 Tax=Aliiroseovarius sp. YM-037 TaxID=3341728 RepID=UPI003A80F806
MKISKISVFQKGLPYGGGGLAVGDLSEERTRTFDTFNSTVVVVETDAGLSGCGESCPWGPTDPGTMRALPILANALLGIDPRQLHEIELNMDAAIEGHTYAKSAIDIACWDILGKSKDVPVYDLLGGKLTDGAPLYRCVMEQKHDKIRAEIEQYRAAGYKYLKLRVGIHPEEDIELIRFAAEIAEPGEVVYADANCRWTLPEAMQVAQAIEDIDVMIEQPCLTYEDCLHLRRNTNQSMKLDELVTDQFIAKRIIRDKAADVACVKMARIGGLTKARRIRDIFVEKGTKVVTECMMGGEIISAAVSHFAASTPANLLFNTTDLHAYNTESTGSPAPPTSDGRLYCHGTPGLGVEPDFESLADPVAVYE